MSARAARGDCATFIAIEFDLGAGGNMGQRTAPAYLRPSGLIRAMRRCGWSIEELQILPCHRTVGDAGSNRAFFVAEVADIVDQVRPLVAQAVRRGDKVVAIGGDHSIVIGTVAGVVAATDGACGVIWLDAHVDLHTHETTTTGRVHGMCLAALCGFGPAEIVRPVSERVVPKNVLLVGANDVARAEAELIGHLAIPVVSRAEIRRRGLAAVSDQLEALRSRVQNVWVSLDVDVVSKREAPGVGMPNPNGLSRHEVCAICAGISRRFRVVGLDVVEVVPSKDVRGTTAKLVHECLSILLQI